jgi:hypothetical protein
MLPSRPSCFFYLLPERRNLRKTPPARANPPLLLHRSTKYCLSLSLSHTHTHTLSLSLSLALFPSHTVLPDNPLPRLLLYPPSPKEVILFLQRSSRIIRITHSGTTLVFLQCGHPAPTLLPPFPAVAPIIAACSVRIPNSSTGPALPCPARPLGTKRQQPRPHVSATPAARSISKFDHQDSGLLLFPRQRPFFVPNAQ